MSPYRYKYMINCINEMEGIDKFQVQSVIKYVPTWQVMQRLLNSTQLLNCGLGIVTSFYFLFICFFNF